jgi:hypothetical protein
VFVAGPVDADGRHQDMVADMQPVDPGCAAEINRYGPVATLRIDCLPNSTPQNGP